MNHHIARGYRFEMEVLGAFYASPLYVTEDDMRLIAGERGYCDGILWAGHTRDNQFVRDQKVCEIEVKLRSTIGKEPKKALIETLQEKHVRSFLQHNLHKDRSNSKRILVVGFTTTLEDQRAQGVCNYDQYGLVAVVYFHKQWNEFDEFRFRQAIRFYDSFHDFNKDLYQCVNLDEYFDLLEGENAVQTYLYLINQKRYNDLIMEIFSKMSEGNYTNTQQIYIMKLLNYQLKIGVDAYFTSLSKALNTNNGPQHLKPFIEKSWIQKTGKKYRVNFEKIIKDLFQNKMKVNARNLLNKTGIDFTDTY
tara:strand:+ start:1978 stop:2895 length:918 start_codon:yes stop_codon:yes gene_type:complete